MLPPEDLLISGTRKAPDSTETPTETPLAPWLIVVLVALVLVALFIALGANEDD
jgi:hypothetical protein